MANYNTPWNKGKKQSPEQLKAKLKAYYIANKEKAIKSSKINREARSDHYKEVAKWRVIKRKYNLTKDQYNHMFTQQGGMCAICTLRPIKCVDHDHSTGKVRGLLCMGCNRDLAILDNPKLLVAAQRYKDAAN